MADELDRPKGLGTRSQDTDGGPAPDAPDCAHLRAFHASLDRWRPMDDHASSRFQRHFWLLDILEHISHYSTRENLEGFREAIRHAGIKLLDEIYSEPPLKPGDSQANE